MKTCVITVKSRCKKAAKYNKKELSTPIFTLTEEEKNKAEEAKKGQCEAFVAMFKDVSKVKNLNQ